MSPPIPHPGGRAAGDPAARLARRFEAIIFDWDGTAVPDRRSDARAVRELIESACGAGMDLAVVSGTHVGNVDGQLRARPTGPGELTLLLNRGSEAYTVGTGGPALLYRRTATEDEEAALSAAARLAVTRLAQRGLQASIVSERFNRRKIDLIVADAAWADPPKARIGELVAAVQERLASAGLGGLADAVRVCAQAAAECGLADARVTSDAKHVEIGLTDKSDSARWLAEHLWHRGIAPSQVLIVGDELGALGDMPGSDSLLGIPELARAVTVSVGAEPSGVPGGVVHLGGGPLRFAGLLSEQLRRRRAGELPERLTDPGWTLTVAGADPLLERVNETLLTLADGRLGTRGSLLVASSASSPGTFMAGVYAGAGPATELLHAPRWSQVASTGPAVEAVIVGMRAQRSLDLHAGLLHQRLRRGHAALEAVQFSCLAHPGTAVTRLRDRGFGLSEGPTLCSSGVGEVDAGTLDGCRWLRVTDAPGSIVAAEVEPDAGAGAAHDRMVSFAGNPDGPAAPPLACAAATAAQARGFERLLSEHRQAWGRRWAEADVGIDGDPALQLAVRFALFHLMASVADRGEAAVGARGLSGEAYRGHVFWDTDVYVLPFAAATHPSSARAMLEYRVRTLPAAMRAARTIGRMGARFSWESATTGEDVTPGSMPDREGALRPVLTGRLEEHVVADVAWASAQYVAWTGDETFARGPGRRLAIETARWWASRIELDAQGGHVRGVIGPDEYHERVDDNAFTNVMARWNLRHASEVTSDAAGVDPGERRRWMELADALVDGYDAASARHEQFAGFFALEPLTVADLGLQRPVPADLVVGRVRTQTSQLVKQPDVLMLHYLVPGELPAGSLAADLDYYEPRLTHGSSLSPGVLAAVLARAGRAQPALDELRLAARIDLDDIGRLTAGGLHLAAMGSVWRALAYGFCGLQAGRDVLTIDPTPLPGERSLEVRVRYHGQAIRLRVGPERGEVWAGGVVPARLPDGETVQLDAEWRSFDLSSRGGEASS